jgi:hypothetical protein
LTKTGFLFEQAFTFSIFQKNGPMNYPAAEERDVTKGIETPQAGGVRPLSTSGGVKDPFGIRWCGQAKQKGPTLQPF